MIHFSFLSFYSCYVLPFLPSFLPFPLPPFSLSLSLYPSFFSCFSFPNALIFSPFPPCFFSFFIPSLPPSLPPTFLSSFFGWLVGSFLSSFLRIVSLPRYSSFLSALLPSFSLSFICFSFSCFFLLHNFSFCHVAS